MNTKTESYSTVSFISDPLHLSFLNRKVEENRKLFVEYAKSLPSPLEKILLAHYNDRLIKAGDNPMLGEYAPFMLGDLLSINEKFVDQLSFPWFLLYEYSLLLDDLLDNKSRDDWKYELLVSQILLDYSVGCFKIIFGQDQYISSSFDNYRKESVESMLVEMSKSLIMKSEISDQAILDQGRKAAFVKFCATTMVYLDKRRELSRNEQSGIDALCCGIQLLDDVHDVIEDHISGQMNILLNEVYTWFQKKNLLTSSLSTIENIGIQQLIIGLVYSRGLTKSWDLASEYLNLGLNYFHEKETKSYSFLHDLSVKCSVSSTTLNGLINSDARLRELLLLALTKGEIETHITINTLNNYTWLKIKEFFKTGPKASN